MSTIENNVMAVVRVIHFGRRLVSRTALECYALVFSILGVATMVSIIDIERNMVLVASSGVSGVITYLFVAIVKTTLIVQIALLLGALSFALLTRDIVRTTKLHAA